MDLSIKNIILAGIGTIAYTYEKATDIVDEMVKKGEITINDGKELNEELKIKMHSKKHSDNLLTTDKLKDILSELDLVTKKDLEGIEKRLKDLENKS